MAGLWLGSEELDDARALTTAVCNKRVGQVLGFLISRLIAC